MNDLDEAQWRQLYKYSDCILRINEHVNLTAVRDREEFLLKHVKDSLLYADLEEIASAGGIVDLGTGAGFPGIPLAVMYPEKEVLLLDSVRKKLRAVEEAAEEADIRGIATLHMRAEDAGRSREYRESFDACVSRAVAPMNVLLELALPLVKVGGHLIAYKGPGCRGELEQAGRALEILGGRLKAVESRKLGNDGPDRAAVIIEKIKSVPSAYPRKAGTAKAAPLV